MCIYTCAEHSHAECMYYIILALLVHQGYARLGESARCSIERPGEGRPVLRALAGIHIQRSLAERGILDQVVHPSRQASNTGNPNDLFLNLPDPVISTAGCFLRQISIFRKTSLNRSGHRKTVTLDIQSVNTGTADKRLTPVETLHLACNLPCC